MRAHLLALLLVGCGGATVVNLKLTNGTERPIDSVYVYQLGAGDHGASRGVIAPHGSMLVKVSGNIEVQALSAVINVDAHTHERRSATTGVELRNLDEVVFYDEGQKPPIPAKALGVQFQHFVAGPKDAPPPEN